MSIMFGNPLNVGHVLGTNGNELILPPSARQHHLYVCGGTGVGKSKLLEHCIRQDIMNWIDSRCGLILLDPHGLVYENIMRWLAFNNLKRPIVPIDLRRDDWIISYNLLRRRKNSDPSVIVSNFVRALSHVWGEDGTDKTPLFARWAGVILLTLYENDVTISDVMQLLSRADIRRAMSAKLTDPAARQAWQFAERQPKEFEQQITSTLNRFNRLLGPKVMKATFGQPDISLDLKEAIEEGKIILVNLSTEGGQIDDEDTDTFATLLLADLWVSAKARGKREGEDVRPFYVYVDECQNFITPTIAKNLDQARGFGLHLTLANQFPSQFLNEGASGKAMYDSVLANVGTKIVFRTEHPIDMKVLAQSLFMNSLNPDEVKLKLYSTKVMGYRQETRKSHTTGEAETAGTASGRGGGTFDGRSASQSKGGSQSFGPDDPTQSEALSAAAAWNEATAETTGKNASWAETETSAITTSQSVTQSIVDVPIMGKELMSVQFRPIEEQIFIATQKLFDQKDRNFAIRFHGGPRAPLFVRTPDVPPVEFRKKYIEAYRLTRLKLLPFCLSLPEAMERLDMRSLRLRETLTANLVDGEPASVRRAIAGE